VTGISVEGVTTKLRKEQIEPDSWKDLLEAYPPGAPAGKE
jgi:hypothetical protein